MIHNEEVGQVNKYRTEPGLLAARDKLCLKKVYQRQEKIKSKRVSSPTPISNAEEERVFAEVVIVKKFVKSVKDVKGR